MDDNENKLAVDAYDATHGKSTQKDTERPSGLTEAGNKPPPQDLPFKNLKSEG